MRKIIVELLMMILVSCASAPLATLTAIPPSTPSPIPSATETIVLPTITSTATETSMANFPKIEITLDPKKVPTITEQDITDGNLAGNERTLAQPFPETASITSYYINTTDLGSADAITLTGDSKYTDSNTRPIRAVSISHLKDSDNYIIGYQVLNPDKKSFTLFHVAVPPDMMGAFGLLNNPDQYQPAFQFTFEGTSAVKVYPGLKWVEGVVANEKSDIVQLSNAFVQGQTSSSIERQIFAPAFGGWGEPQ